MIPTADKKVKPHGRYPSHGDALAARRQEAIQQSTGNRRGTAPASLRHSMQIHNAPSPPKGEPQPSRPTGLNRAKLLPNRLGQYQPSPEGGNMMMAPRRGQRALSPVPRPGFQRMLLRQNNHPPIVKIPTYLEAPIIPVQKLPSLKSAIPSRAQAG